MTSQSVLERSNLYAEKIKETVDRTYEVLKYKKYADQYRKYILIPLAESYGSRAPRKFLNATKKLLHYFEKNEPYKLFDQLKAKRRKMSKEETIANWFNCLTYAHDSNARGTYSQKLPSEIKDEEKRNYAPSLGELENIVLSRRKSKK